MGSDPNSIDLGDVNGDGRPDLAAANLLSHTVSVLLNTTATGAPAPSFAAQVQFPVGSFPWSITVGDVNGDGRPDLAVTNSVSDTVSVLLNTTATGALVPAFAAQVQFPVGDAPASVALGDVNGDGRPDLAVANSSADTVSILLNTTATGAPAPSFAAQVPFPVGSSPRSVALGDVNGDGRRDMAVANAVGDTVSVLLNTTATGAPAPAFAAHVQFPVGDAPLSVALGDVNGDGRPDMALANLFDNTVSVLLNTTATGAPAPAFAAQVAFPGGNGPNPVALRDVNGDGRPDVAAANSPGNTVSILLNTTATGAPAPAFAAQVQFPVGNLSRSVALGDVNGDGRPDVATANLSSNTVSVLLNTCVLSPDISTTLSNPGPVPAGTSVNDTATLIGSTLTAGGSVTYRVYSDTACTALVATAGTKTVTNAVVPPSDSIAFNTPGTFYWQAAYSGEANNNPAVSPCLSETLVVTSTALSLTKAFNPATVPAGGTSTLTFTVANSNAIPLTNVAFTDNLPAGMVVASPANISNTCAGALTATPGSSTVTLATATLAANSNCTVSVRVRGISVGALQNTTGPVTSDQTPPGAAANATLNVTSTSLALAKAFSPTSIPVSGTSTLTFTVTNGNAIALTNVAFTDNMPAGMVIANPPNVSNTCAGVLTATPGSSSVTLAGATVAANGSCAVSLTVQGNTAGAQINTTGPITADQTPAGPAASATLNVTATSLSLAKAFSPTAVQVNTAVTLTFIVTNGSTVPQTAVSFTDNLPSGMTVANPANVTNTCGGNLSAVAGSGVVALTGGTVAAQSSCTVSVRVLPTSTGNLVNTTGTVSSAQSGPTGGAAATATLAVSAEPATPTPTAVPSAPPPVIPQIFQNPGALGAVQAGNRATPTPRLPTAASAPAAVIPAVVLRPPNTGDAGLLERGPAPAPDQPHP